MSYAHSLLMGGVFAGLLAGMALPALADGSHKLAGTRFEMEVPNCWNTGYKDPKSGTVLEGVYLRGAQPASFTLADFKKARIDQQIKAYEGKGHKVAKEGDTTIGGAKGNYLLTTWKDGGKDMEKHTAQYLNDGHRYMVVMWGEKGKTDKKVFDHAVKTFALAKP